MPADATTATYGAFLERLATRTASAASSASDASTSASVVATSADAYAAYVALTRSGLWTDVVPATCPSTGLTYMFCLPRETPTERRKDVPREARSRTVAVPFAVARACASPALLDAVTRVADAESWPDDARATAVGPTTPRLLVMLDSDGTTTTCAVSRDFVPPKDIPEKNLDGDATADAGIGDDEDSDDDAGARGPPASALAPRPAFSDGESDEELLEDDRKITLAQRHARPDADADADA